MDILEEVLDDTKQASRISFFEDVLPRVVMISLMLTIGIGAYYWNQNRLATKYQGYGDRFTRVMDKSFGDEFFKKSSLEHLIEDEEEGFKDLAQIQFFIDQMSKNSTEGSLKQLEIIINGDDYNKITNSYARILWLSVILDRDKILDEDQKKAAEYLNYFTEENQVFFASAMLMKSMFYKKTGKQDLAKESANKLLSLEDAPTSLKNQARAVIASL